MGEAANDLRATEALLALSPPLVDEMVLRCEQAAEKALTGFLVWRGRPFRRMHNLKEICERGLQVHSTLRSVIDQAVPLTEYAWKFRYPPVMYELTPNEAAEALVTARLVCGAVLDRLPAEVRP